MQQATGSGRWNVEPANVKVWCRCLLLVIEQTHTSLTRSHVHSTGPVVELAFSEAKGLGVCHVENLALGPTEGYSPRCNNLGNREECRNCSTSENTYVFVLPGALLCLPHSPWHNKVELRGWESLANPSSGHFGMTALQHPCIFK